MLHSDYSQAALDYQRIEKAIAYLTSNRLAQPDLASAARAAHLSEFHFQKVFTRWAGISPKRFVQFLTLEHARNQLTSSKALLETAIDLGLSGPGRLHDLFVTLEAVTPGEFKSRGAGVNIEYGFHQTPFGVCLLGATARGVCWLSFLLEHERRSALKELNEHWRGARVTENQAVTGALTNRIFSKVTANGNSSLSVLVMGTNFQVKVWEALLRIPAGRTTTYEAVSELIGASGSTRAVGSAIGANAISYLIPCHRVIRKSGALGGYRWGPIRKQAILAWEAAQGTSISPRQ